MLRSLRHKLGVERRSRPWADQRGDAIVEYVVVFGTIAVPLIPALMAAGLALVRLFETTRNLLLMPIP